MADRFPLLGRARSRLAFHLGARAAAGLALLALVALAGFAAALWSVTSMWRSFIDGAWLSAILWGGAFALAASLASRSVAWLRVPPAPPQGVLLVREAAPSLHRLIDRVGRRFGIAGVHSVWVTGEMNAAVLQRPRWGSCGPMETHLMIGLPLAHSVSRRQFTAILAHEFAHLRFQRRGLAAWASFARAWWFRALERCIEDSPRLAPWLERRTAPGLHATLRLSRLEEFEADAMASRVVGARLLGETLVEVALKERFLYEDYWRRVMAQRVLRPRPSIRPYRDMGLGMVAGFRRPARGALHVESLFGERSSALDLHPSLEERLRALRVTPQVDPYERGSAADCYLAPLLTTLAWVFDRAWWRDARRSWRLSYTRARRSPRP